MRFEKRMTSENINMIDVFFTANEAFSSVLSVDVRIQKRNATSGEKKNRTKRHHRTMKSAHTCQAHIPKAEREIKRGVVSVLDHSTR
jgi:hypothetical protein